MRFNPLGIITLMMVTEDRKSRLWRTLHIPQKLISIVEKIIGEFAVGYSFPISSKTIYARKLSSSNAEYVHWTKKDIVDALPKSVHLMADHIMEIFNITQGILAPLRVDDEFVGLMMVSGLSLSEEDVSILDFFAGQIAAGLYNVRLMQKLADELAARKGSEESLAHNRDLLLALNRAEQYIQQAYTADEVFRAVGSQVKSLGGEITLLTLEEDRQSLIAAYMSYDASARKLEKLTGTSAIGYRIALLPDSVYARDIVARKAEYIHSAKGHFYDAFPKETAFFGRPVYGRRTLNVEQGILAPLHVEGETLGLMMVSGLDLNEGDVPAMEFFAGQIAAGLQNARLMQKVQDELSARKQIEEFSES